MKHVLFTLTFLFALVAITGCDNFDLMLSEKKLNSKIQKSWKIVSSSPNDDKKETWTFNGGTVSVAQGTDTTFSGHYYIDARWSKAYVSLSKFTFSGYSKSGFTAIDLNRKWTIAELDGGVMYLSTKNEAGAIISLEFIEQ